MDQFWFDRDLVGLNFGCRRTELNFLVDMIKYELILDRTSGNF